ncbi:MAG TPA: penicillin-binding protein [Patescibacteria group bacterium]|nr:penicillin-binding protein [Patescibacteria group bacterium]
MVKKSNKYKKTGAWKNQVVKTSYHKTGIKKRGFSKKKFFVTIFWLALFALVFSVLMVAWISRDIPNPNQLLEREINQSTKIYDRTGEHILYEIHGDEKRTLVSLSDLPDYVKFASVAIEDKNFFNHGGFSVWAMVRTLITNIIYNRRAGGSTLTQQFVKNAVLTPEKKITRKIKEIVLSYQLEKKFSKDEILQMYLNEIPYGSNAYGVEAASLKYFNKNAKDLSIAEAALLASLVQSPTRYSPYGPNKDLLLGRKDYVITLMAEQGYISNDEADAAKQEEIIFAGPETNITAPHFVMYIKNILAEKYGEKMVEQEGLRIYTTLDLYKQKIAEEVIAEKTANYKEKYNASNASLVSIDPKTGQILAMVGSRDYFDNDIDGQVNVSLRPRQPGSSMKPLVYAALFSKGYTPDTILYDVETNFSNSAESYIPKNYNLKELGPVNIRKALAGSLNIPAVKALYLAGVNNVLNLAEEAGYTTLYPRDRFGLALVLGGAEVTLLEHTNAYSAFARDGKVNNTVSILKIEDKNGNIIEEYKSEEREVLDSQVARMVNSILSDNEARTYAFGANNDLTISGRPVAAKTGTTNDYRDAWTIGYTPSIVTGVWVGNNNNDEMKGAGGSVLAAPIWNSYMKRVLGDTPVEEFKKPNDYKTGKNIIDGEIPETKVKIDISTGGLATNTTPPELVSEILIPVHHSILFYVDTQDPIGDIPENPEKDPQFNLWEDRVVAWAEKNSTSTQLLKKYEELYKPENSPEITIITPQDKQDIDRNNLVVEVSTSAARGVSSISYFINGGLWYLGGGNEYVIDKELPPLKKGYHNLTVRSCDDVNNCSESSLDFNYKNQTNFSNKNSSVSINYPSSGVALNKIDFPLKTSLSVVNFENAARLLVFSVKEDGASTNLMADFTNLNSSLFEAVWENIPEEKGVYKIYGELRTWEGEVIKSNEVTVTIS